MKKDIQFDQSVYDAYEQSKVPQLDSRPADRATPGLPKMLTTAELAEQERLDKSGNEIGALHFIVALVVLVLITYRVAKFLEGLRLPDRQSTRSGLVALLARCIRYNRKATEKAKSVQGKAKALWDDAKALDADAREDSSHR